MYIILSQKIDIESSYSDDIGKLYHYPRRYKNQIHEGDVFVYYQGNRYNREHRYYFGTGVIKRIVKSDTDDYYAELFHYKEFQNKVPIYFKNGYIESEGFSDVRKSKNPPWQSSIRPLSEAAYNQIMLLAFDYSNSKQILDQKLKSAVRKYYLENDYQSVIEINELSKQIISLFRKMM